MARYRVTITGRDYNAMADLVRQHRVAVVRQTAIRRSDGTYRVQAFAEPEQVQILEASGYQLERHEDAEALGRERQIQVQEADARRALAVAAEPPHYL